MNGTMLWSDQKLEAEVRRVERELEAWMRVHDLWFDCGFKAYLSHVDDEPAQPPIVTLFWSEGPMYTVLSGEDPEGSRTRILRPSCQSRLLLREH